MSALDGGTVYLNGEFVPAAQAKVSVFDRGFVFGDGVYEYVPVFGRRLFRMSQHLARFEASLKAVRIPNPLAPARWHEIFERLVALTAAEDQSIYIQVTRGVAPRDHGFPHNVAPTVFAYAQALKYPKPEQRAQGAAAVTAADIRWERCDIKAVTLLANVLLRQQALEVGAAEAILVRDGVVTEGTSSNIFIVLGGRALTPPTGRFILPGITRDLVLELMRAQGIACEERTLNESELRAAEEIWLTSSSREILPITRLNGRAIGAGTPGPLYARVFALYREYKRAFCEGKLD